MHPCRSLATSGIYITREDDVYSAIELHSYQATQLTRIRDICTRRLLLTQGCRCRPLMSYVLLVSPVERRVKNRNSHPQRSRVGRVQYIYKPNQFILSIVSLKQLLLRKSSSYLAEHIIGCLDSTIFPSRIYSL